MRAWQRGTDQLVKRHQQRVPRPHHPPVDLAAITADEAGIRDLELEIRRQRMREGQIALMQETEMGGIEAAFKRLQPVAFLQTPADAAMRRWQLGPFDGREIRLSFPRSHISPDQPAALDARIGRGFYALLERAGCWLGRKVDAITLDVELPAM